MPADRNKNVLRFVASATLLFSSYPLCSVFLLLRALLLNSVRSVCPLFGGVRPTGKGHLMKQVLSTMWKSRYFRLEDDILTFYDTKSLVGTRKNKVRRS